MDRGSEEAWPSNFFRHEIVVNACGIGVPSNQTLSNLVLLIMHLMLFAGYPVSSYGQTIGLDELVAQNDRVHEAYSKSSWLILDQKAMPPTLKRVVIAGSNSKVEFLAADSIAYEVRANGPRIAFQASRGSKGDSWKLLDASSRSAKASDDMKFFNTLIPTHYPWSPAGVDLRKIVKSNEVSCKLEFMVRDGVSVVRLSIAKRRSSQPPTVVDFRPDLGHVIDRFECYSHLQTRPPSTGITIYKLDYVGVLSGGVAKLSKVKAMLKFNDGENAFKNNGQEFVVHDYLISELTAADHDSDIFEPGHYGIGYRKPSSQWWRWVAGIAGVIGIATAFWWLRRRRMAAG